MTPTTVHVILCQPVGFGGLSYTATELLDNLPGPLLQPRLWFPQGNPAAARVYHRPVFSHFVWRALCKANIPMAWQGWVVAEIALRNVHPGEIVYVWPPYNTAMIRRAKERGAVLVAERVNCMGPMCKTVLERAYARIGRPLPSGWCNPEDMEEERIQMALCDWVTAPNDFVAQSLIDSGIPSGRILKTSYGWSPARLANAMDLNRPDRPPVFAFVGLGIVRKGLDLLLECWERADISGTLLIAGVIDDDIRRLYSRQLARPDVQALGHVRDMASVYAAADVFVLPTHEESGPQVTYEAAGCGLPSIVSPMGAGPVVRNDQEGFIIDPFDIDGWVKAIRSLARDSVLRRRFGASASSRAKEYTWERASARLYGHLIDCSIAGRTNAGKQSGADNRSAASTVPPVRQ